MVRCGKLKHKRKSRLKSKVNNALPSVNFNYFDHGRNQLSGQIPWGALISSQEMHHFCLESSRGPNRLISQEWVTLESVKRELPTAAEHTRHEQQHDTQENSMPASHWNCILPSSAFESSYKYEKEKCESNFNYLITTSMPREKMRPILPQEMQSGSISLSTVICNSFD